RCDCTTRNEKKALMLSRRMDDLEARIVQLAAHEELKAIRPEMDGKQVMEFLELPPSPTVGKAMSFLLDLRLEEGLLGDDEVRARLRAWWVARGE
ncbi:MAG: CCA tRNA nucleotidyltransferase, partial [Actinobacteria bacterium]|nr:CCA tRNA nucleotidyltransferase [Actinomycetota bacterium]